MKMMKMLKWLLPACLVAGAVATPSHLEEQKAKFLSHRQRHDKRSLIVGGQTVDQTRYPYYTILDIEVDGGFFFCGATLIHDDIVLTTGDCSFNVTAILAVVNYTDDTGLTGYEQFRDATDIVVHPDYNRENTDYDIAILRLDSRALSSPFPKLNTERPVPANGDPVTAIGFGSLSLGGEFPAILQEVVVDVVPGASCNSVNSYNDTVRVPRMICARADGKDSCQGDAGGPLIVPGATATDDLLVGINSFGIGCADPNFPGIYTRVSFFEEWIQDQICLLSRFRPADCPSLPPSNAPTITGAPTSPTASPAPTISNAPSMSPTRGSSFNICFSGSSTVETPEGTIRMDELKLGDKVLSDNNQFETVYGFGHNDKDITGSFLQIATDSKHMIELSPDHMVFVDGDRAIPASSVKVGDKLMLFDGVLDSVKAIKTVVRQGAFAPFTNSGILMVNGVKASSFVAFQGSESLMGMSYQWLAHVFEAPHRMVCRVGYCQTETYSAEGISRWVYAPLKFSEWMLEQSPLMMASMFLPLAGVFGLVWMMEQYPLSVMGGLFVMVGLMSNLRVEKAKRL
mmetsp:Transcript_26075/g.60544  ORF Transcript_26075/g.60544 Transcript_26075/m.60544 type:complete len:571 (-) Transcript_26075:218-1930(-)